MPSHFDRVLSPYSKEQLFQLVLDIEKYPEFLPWCHNAQITEKLSDNELYADLTINFKAFFYNYTSHIIIDEIQNVAADNLQIKVKMVQGPFKTLVNNWKFEDTEDGKGCYINFDIDITLKSVFLNKMLNLVFDHTYKKMLHAFEERADQIYGNNI